MLRSWKIQVSDDENRADLLQKLLQNFKYATFDQKMAPDAGVQTLVGPLTSIRIGALGKVTAVSPSELAATTADE